MNVSKFNFVQVFFISIRGIERSLGFISDLLLININCDHDLGNVFDGCSCSLGCIVVVCLIGFHRIEPSLCAMSLSIMSFSIA